MSLSPTRADSVLKISCLPQIISRADHCHMYGILRTTGNEDSIVIMLPANTGTRIGPQRLFVQISDHLLKQGIATLCLDLPIHGDSLSLSKKDYGSGREDRMIAYYEDHLKLVVEHLHKNFQFTEVIPLSISFGCIPVLRFAQKTGLKRAILLSPNHKLSEVERVNTDNLRAYKHKLFSQETWKKALRMDINYKKVIDNVLNLSELRQTQPKSEPLSKPTSARNSALQAVDVLCIFGENDASIDEHKDYWMQQSDGGQYERISLETINGADHSFFGWTWKESVGQTICAWLK